MRASGSLLVRIVALQYEQTTTGPSYKKDSGCIGFWGKNNKLVWLYCECLIVQSVTENVGGDIQLPAVGMDANNNIRV